VSSPPPFSHPGPAPLHPEVPDGITPAPRPAGVPPARRGGLAAVPVWAPFLALVAAFVVASIASLLIVAGTEAAGMDVELDDLPAGITIGATFVQDIALVGLAVLFVRMWVKPVRPSTLGLRRTPVRAAIGWTALVYACFWVLAGIYAALVGPGPEQELVDELRGEDSLLVLAGFGCSSRSRRR
jgi:hypothetical protein